MCLRRSGGGPRSGALCLDGAVRLANGGLSGTKEHTFRVLASSGDVLALVGERSVSGAELGRDGAKQDALRALELSPAHSTPALGGEDFLVVVSGPIDAIVTVADQSCLYRVD